MSERGEKLVLALHLYRKTSVGDGEIEVLLSVTVDISKAFPLSYYACLTSDLAIGLSMTCSEKGYVK